MSVDVDDVLDPQTEVEGILKGEIDEFEGGGTKYLMRAMDSAGAFVTWMASSPEDTSPIATRTTPNATLPLIDPHVELKIVK